MRPAPSHRTSPRRWGKWIGVIGALGLAAVVVPPATHLAWTALQDRPTIPPTPSGFADDVSRLSRTRVREVWSVPSEAAEAERQLAALVRRARAERLPLSVAGAQHSMGGHTLAPDGVVISMRPFRAMRLSADGRILTVGAGATWAEVIPYLDAHGRAVGVMQSDNAFTVGGSLSANVHGWQTGRPPIASTVRSFRLLTPDGRIVRCSRTARLDLFAHVLGGYGLFGVILDAELETVPNEWYAAERVPVTADGYAAAFAAHVARDTAVAMAYGRLSVAPRSFLHDGVLTFYRRATPPGQPPLPPLARSPFEGLERAVFRGTVGNDYGKALRWRLESGLAGRIEPDYVSRNGLMNSRVETYANRSAGGTEVLHEYFLPPERLGAFVGEARRILRRHDVDLINVTLRDVRADRETALPYARRDVIAAVMLFHLVPTETADATMAAATRELIDAALALGGTYYLPYRPHATRAQFERAYPMARTFFATKARVDPDTLFRTRFFLGYAPR